DGTSLSSVFTQLGALFSGLGASALKDSATLTKNASIASQADFQSALQQELAAKTTDSQGVTLPTLQDFLSAAGITLGHYDPLTGELTFDVSVGHQFANIDTP